MRRTLSVLKSIYQDAAVSLALPDDPGEGKERGNRRRCADCSKGSM